MLILLPPSETKTAPEQGDPVAPDELSFPSLAPHRARVLRALERVSGQRNALEHLGVGASLEAEVRRNLGLREAPAAPALEVYTGVLYDALDRGDWSAPERRVAAESLVVVSALWGAVRPADRIPAYRLSMGTALRGLGSRQAVRLSSFWRPHLAAALGPHADGRLVVDCRSSAYAAAYAAPPETTVTVAVVTQTGDRRTAVSHFAKHTRGELARHVIGRVADGCAVDTPQRLAEVAGARWQVELEPPRGARAGRLTVVLPGR